MFSFRRFVKGILLKGEASDPTNNLEGSVWHNSTSNDFKAYIAAQIRIFVFGDKAQTLTNKTMDANSNTFSNFEHGAEVDNPSSGVHGVTGDIVGTSDSQTLSNKTIDADNNTISNLEVDNLKSGVLDVDLSSVSASDDTIPSAKATKAYVDDSVGGLNTDLSDHISDTSTHGVSGDIVGTTDTQTLESKKLNNDSVEFVDNVDASKVVKFNSSSCNTSTETTLSFSSSVNRNISFPDGDSTVVLTQQSQTINNKTINADNNTLSNIEVDNLKSGVLDTDLSSVSASDDTIPSAKATKAYVDAHINDASDAHAASAVSAVDNFSNSASTDVQNVLEDFDSAITAAASSGGGLAKWVASTSYSIDDIVWYSVDDKVYRCITANSDATFTPAKWTALSKEAESLDELSDVDVTTDTPSQEDLLRYDGSNFIPSTDKIINYISNSRAESNLSGWWEVNDGTAKDVPDNSGTPTQTYTIFSRITSGQLRGGASFRFSNGSSNKKGTSVFYAFTLDSADFTKMLRTALDFADSANVADASFKFFLAHSDDNFASDFNLIRLTPEDLAAGTKTFEAYGQAHHTNTSYRFYIFCADSSTSLLQLDFDNVQVGPSSAVIASSSIGFRATSNAQPSIPNANFTDATRVVFEDLDYDTANKYNTSTGKYTIKESGRWRFDAAAVLRTPPVQVWTDTEYAEISIYVNDIKRSSSRNALTGSSFNYMGLTVGDTLDLNEGDVVHIRIYQDCNEALTLINVSSNNYFSGSKVGGNQDAGSGRKVIEDFNGNSGESITGDVTNIPFANVNGKSTHGAWNGSEFEAPYTDLFYYAAIIQMTSSTAGSLHLFLDTGSGYTRVQPGRPHASGVYERSEGSIYLNKGDKIAFRYSGSITLTNNTQHKVTISNAHGSSQPVAGDIVIALRATQDAGQNIPNASTTTVIFEDVDYDTNNSYNNTTGVYTAKESGHYNISSAIQFPFRSWGSGKQWQLLIVKNSSEIVNQTNYSETSTSQAHSMDLDTDLYLDKGDTIQIRCYHNEGGSNSLTAASKLNYLTIRKVK
jgi:hypothetical protein